MAHKQLRATVRIDTNSAVRSLDKVLTKINQINRAITQTSSSVSNMSNQLNKSGHSANTMANQVQRTHGIFSRLLGTVTNFRTTVTNIITKFGNLVSKVGNVVRQHFGWSNILSRIRQGYQNIHNKGVNIGKAVSNWANNQNNVNAKTRSTDTLLGSVWSKLKRIAATYLGIMGMKGMINTSDIITSAQNKINYLNGNDVKATQEAMDKMYVSAQKVRMSYTDMMSNVSKSMALAGDAFQGNIDNAIRFQEIMAEAYAVGGASAAEMSSSMYQLIQALGANTLAGDELRSVREGAPLAYKAIEKFAQGVYNTTDSLKEMGSQGKITGDMVVAAIMNAGNQMDTAFAQTAQTFAQTWEQIKNVAKKAFEPVSNMMRDALNKAIDNGLIQKIETVFMYISKTLQIIGALIGKVFGWIANNWDWLKNVLITGLIMLAGYFVYTATVAIISAIASMFAWMMLHPVLTGILIAVAGLIYIFLMWREASISTCEAIVYGLLVVGAAIMLVGLLMGSWITIAIGLVIILLGVMFHFFEQVCGGAMWLFAVLCNIAIGITNFVLGCIFALASIIQIIMAFIGNLALALVNTIVVLVTNLVAFIVNLAVACANAIVAISHNAVALIINVGMGLGNSLRAVATNIGIAFENAWIWAKNSFWEFIADVLTGVSKLEPVINGIAKLIGKSGVNFSGAISSARSHKSSYKSYVDVGSAWSSGASTIGYKDIGSSWSDGWNTMDYGSVGDAWSSGWNTFGYSDVGDAWSNGWNTFEYKNLSDAYDKGANWGAGVKDSVNAWGSDKVDKVNNLLGTLGDKFSLDNLGNSLGLNLGSMTGFPNANDPNYGVGGGYDPSSALKGLKDGVGDVGKNTKSIADSMDLTEEDLEYLRRIAEMEWKKEFTTATIKVDMSNYNNINGESDLDGIVTKLTDKLYEELSYVADGVYV